MGLFTGLVVPSRIGALNALDDRYYYSSYANYGGQSLTGLMITEDTAMQASALWACFPAGTLITHADGRVVPIESTQVGDKVRTHTTQSYHVIETTHRLYTGEYCTIRRSGGPPISVTADHLFYAARRPVPGEWWAQGAGGRCPDKLVYEWIPAKALRRGDFLTEPVSLDSKNIKAVMVVVKERTTGKHKGKAPVYDNVLQPIGITPDLMRFIGYFLSEGFFNGAALEFALHEDEKEYQAEIRDLGKRIFGANSAIRPGNGHAITLSMPSTTAVSLCKAFGRRAKEKLLPYWVFDLAPELQSELLIGAWRGDGCWRGDGWNIDTASRQLAEGLRVISLRLGMIPTLTEICNTVPLPDGTKRARTLYRLSYTGLNGARLEKLLGKANGYEPNRSYTFIANGMAHYPVRDVTGLQVVGLPVYNLEVEGDHSYVAGGVSAHNCVRLISQTEAMVPLVVFRRLSDDRRERAADYYLYRVLHDQPNEYQTAMEFREMMTAHCLLTGNAFARLVPGRRGAADQLLPMHPNRMYIQAINGRVQYRYQEPDGRTSLYEDSEIFHLRGLSNNSGLYSYLGYQTDGRLGMSVLQYARESIGLSLATQEYGARLFGQGTQMSGVLKHPKVLSENAQKRLKADFEARTSGQKNWHRPLVLEEGMDWMSIQMTAEDAQMLQSRQFQIADIARWFGVPLHMIQEETKDTSWGSGIEELSMGFIRFTMQPWAVRWEQAIARDLIRDNRQYYAEHLFDALLRGDLKSRYDAYAVARNWGWLSVNDIRRRENDEPVEKGDIYLQPLNMVEAGAPPPEPAPTVLPMPKEEPEEEPEEEPPMPMKKAASNGHYALLLREAAGRVVRKEIAAVSKHAKRCASDPQQWEATVKNFYAEHVAYVEHTLGFPEWQATGYCEMRKDALLTGGVTVLEHTEAAMIEHLVKLAIGGSE